jgi:RHS repeat-associated protein
MTLANNGDAKVSRTYYPNGLIESETQKIRTLADVGSGGNFTDHVYTVSYEYDLAGRNTKISVPTQLAPRVQTDTLAAVFMLSGHDRDIHDEITYTYDTGTNGTGWLSEVDGLLPGETFKYFYTPRGEISQLSAMTPVPDAPTPRVLQEFKTYNFDGSLTEHTDVAGLGGSAETMRHETFTVDPVGRVLGSTDDVSWGIAILPTESSFTYSGLGQMLSSEIDGVSDTTHSGFAATETVSYDPLGNWTTRYNASQWANQYRGRGSFLTTGHRTAHYDQVSGRLVADSLDGSRRDTLLYDDAGNQHAMLTTNAGNPVQYNERVSYYGVDGRLAAADARAAGNPGTGIVGHAAFEEYRYDALGRRIMARARRWCEDESGSGHNGDEAGCDLSTIRRTVWSGSSELAEIQMPAADDDNYLTPTDTVENDTLAVHRTRNGVPQQVDYDANRAFGIVLYVHGLSTDQPVAVTRVNYADATDFSVGSTTWKVYAPFSTIPLWNSRGRADRAVMGGTAAPGGDRICEDSSHDRCVELGLVWGEFSYMILADKLGAWQGTLLLDKPDATGTFYRRNRSYDPNTARFTQEDPIGLAGGMNLYGFAAGDPVSYSDPFGLCPPEDNNLTTCTGFWTVTGALLGGALGGTGGGAGGFFAGAGVGAIPGAAAGGLEGALLGARLGAALDLLILASKSHTTAVVDISGHGRTRVDWEEPTDDTPGNVHVQGKGKGGIPKVKIESLDDLKKLPRSIRENKNIRRGIERALEQLRKFRESNAGGSK